jgi:hypothetical protein
MQFLTNLFGAENTLPTAILALGIVLVLIVAAVWVLKFVFRASTNVGWGRNRRLMVVDSMHIDPKRQLVIVRRDNVEHLIMTGGPQDMVVESNIPVEKNAVRRPVPFPVAVNHNGTAKPNPFIEPEDDRGPARSAIDRLRDFTRPLNKGASTSLRHTGLMRASSKMEVVAGNGNGHAKTDSAKTPVVIDKEQTKVGEAGYPRDGAKAGGH